MKKLIIISIVLFFSSFCFSQHEKKNKKDYQLDYEEFITHYGVDDTSIAIIDIFYDKRKNCAGGKISFLPLSAGITLINPSIGVGLMAVSTPLFVSGTITHIKYNRKHLLKALVDYQNQNLIPKNLKKRIVTYLEIEAENYQDEIEEAELASLKTIN